MEHGGAFGRGATGLFIAGCSTARREQAMSRRAAALAIRLGRPDCLDEDAGAEPGVQLSAEQIDEVVHQLNGICRNSSLEFALRVGAVIIHHFYAGDAHAWRDRGPKVHSFRRLAEHPELALSAGAIYRCVAI